MKTHYVFFFATLSFLVRSQVNVSTGSYSQNFGTANITSWTDNSTFAGWYISGNFIGQANLGGSPNLANSGGFYSYNCGSDSKIGSRASTSTSNLYYGVVLRNTTGQVIRSIRVSYSGFQMSLATNGNHINTMTFDYIVSTTTPAITAGAGTSVPALNFQQLQNSSISGGNQLNWYPCTQSATKSACIPVTIANNSYILLRWKDNDDGANDHHMALDNVQVAFDMSGGTCLSFLPVELLYFNANYNGTDVDLEWATASEKNNSYFTVERSPDGLAFEEVLQVKGASKAAGKTDYKEEDRQPLEGISYYRLKQTDRDGTVAYSSVEAVETDQVIVNIFPNPTETGIVNILTGKGTMIHISVVNSAGQLVMEK